MKKAILFAAVAMFCACEKPMVGSENDDEPAGNVTLTFQPTGRDLTRGSAPMGRSSASGCLRTCQ